MFTEAGKWDISWLTGEKYPFTSTWHRKFSLRDAKVWWMAENILDQSQIWESCTEPSYIFSALHKKKSFGFLKEKGVGEQVGRKRREREGREGAKEVGRKKMEKTSLILYTKSWPEAKCQQATYKQKSKMERLRNLTLATWETLLAIRNWDGGWKGAHVDTFFTCVYYRVHESLLGFLKHFTCQVWMTGWVGLGQQCTPTQAKLGWGWLGSALH